MRHRKPQQFAFNCLACASVAAALAFGVVPPLRSVASSEANPAFRIVVHAQNPSAAVSREFVADAFFKRTRRWDDGTSIRPVDLRSASPVRERFCDAVLQRSVAAVRSYWQQRIFSGRDLPPPELDSDAAVIEFVSRHPGAIGYVSGSARLGDTKEVSVR